MIQEEINPDTLTVEEYPTQKAYYCLEATTGKCFTIHEEENKLVPQYEKE